MSVSDRTVRDWLSRVDKDAKEARDKRIFDMWLACYTIEDIAEETSASKSDVDRVVKSFSQNGDIAELGKSDQASATHASAFDPPIYNIWKQQTKSEGSSHFGNSESRWVLTEVAG